MQCLPLRVESSDPAGKESVLFSTPPGRLMVGEEGGVGHPLFQLRQKLFLLFERQLQLGKPLLPLPLLPLPLLLLLALVLTLFFRVRSEG